MLGQSWLITSRINRREKVASKDTSLHLIPSQRHGILNEDIGGTQELVTSFLMSLSPAEEYPAPGEIMPHEQEKTSLGGAA